MDAYAPLRPIMKRCQTQLAEGDFHSAVNVTFHRYESEEYDEGHQDMWQSLPREFELLVGDILADARSRGVEMPERMRMLDIGCGTGLATDCLLGTALGARVSEIALVDTSAAMLGRVKKRAEGWGRPLEVYEGLLDDVVPAERPFDLIITSSVLHHVPDLPAFFAAVARRQKPGAYFLHIQDPNGDAMRDPGYEQRRADLDAARGAAAKTPEWLARLNPKRILGRLQRELNGTQGQDCASRAIRQLQDDGVTPKPLTVAELYQITDIHVNNDVGLALEQLREWIGPYQMVGARSYGFFGVLESDLPPELALREREYSAAGSMSGIHLGAVWRRS